MSTNDFAQIEALIELKFRKRQQVFFRIVAEEDRLRAQLSQLAHMESTNAKTELGNMQHIGADVIWKAWLNRTRSALHLELAQVLAQKEMLRDGVRKDFAKVAVTEELVALHKAEEIKAKTERQLSDAITHQQIRKLYQLS